MRSEKLLPVAIVVLLLLGPVLWFLFTPTPVPPLPAIGKAPAPDVAKAKVETADPPPRARIDAEPPPVVSKPEAAPKAPEAPKQGTAKAARIALRVELTGLLDEIPAADALVSLRSQRDAPRAAMNAKPRKGSARRGDDDLDPRTIDADAGAGAVLLLDVAPLFEGDESRTVTIDVDRAGYLPASSSAVCGEGRRPSIQIPLVPAAFGTGTVQDDRGRALLGAEVSSFVHRDGAWQFVDSTLTGEDGAYRLRLVGRDANLVVAAAEGFVPAYSELTGFARVDATLRGFRLARGLGVTGTVRYGDGRDVPGALVLVTPSKLRPSLASRLHRFAFDGADLFLSPASTHAKDGVFSLEGLLPGDHDVDVYVGNVSSALCASRRKHVLPSRDGLAFVLDGGTIVADVTADSGLLGEAVVSFTCGPDAMSARTDDRGLAEAVGVPGRVYEMTVAAEGFQSVTQSVAAPEAGLRSRVRVVLRRI